MVQAFTVIVAHCEGSGPQASLQSMINWNHGWWRFIMHMVLKC